MTVFSPSCLSTNTSFFNESSYRDKLNKEFNLPLASCVYHSNQKTEKNHTPRSVTEYLFKRLSKWCILPPVPKPEDFEQTLLSQMNNWKYKRITILADGLSIDAAIMGRPSTLSNKKWVMTSVGRCERYEEMITSQAFKTFLKNINSNAIFFNYPKVGSTKGSRNAKNMVTAYKAVLQFLEDEQKGIGAKKIIGYGYSIGGGVQGESLRTHDLEKGIKQGIQYLFVKDRTFSTLERAAKSLTKGILEWVIPRFGWTLNSVESSAKLSQLKIHEIIVQTTDEQHQPITDGVISKNASLKKEILNSSLPYKWYVNIPNHNAKNLHSCSMDHFSKQLTEKINDLIK